MMVKSSNSYLKRFELVKENYNLILDNIVHAAIKSGRKPEDITLLAATKTVSAEVINYAIGLGINCIGENRVQELLYKYDSLNLENVKTHFIGHLQTNKVKQIIPKVNMVESVDSVRLAKEISIHSKNLNTETDILVEINIGREVNKSGVLVEYLYDFLKEISQFDSIKVRGLMAIPPICDEVKDLERYFSKMQEIFIDISEKNMDNICMDVLSMGMSGDYLSAIKYGANIVRIGSALFGKRSYI